MFHKNTMANAMPNGIPFTITVSAWIENTPLAAEEVHLVLKSVSK